MNLLSIENLCKAYGEKILFGDISFGINEGQKVALVAKNGTGKSTLLKIIAGKETADSGKVVFRKDARVAYLEQDPVFNFEKTVLQVIFEGDNPLMEIIRDYEHYLYLQEHEYSEENFNKLMDAQQKMDELNCWEYETRAKKILSGLEIHDYEQKIKQLSGGQIKRIALAGILIQEPDLVIMDEPTNHLDVDMVEWLEEYLGGKNISLFLVTHDRYFLDNVCDEIVELENGNMTRFKGNYSYYVEKKSELEKMKSSELDKARNLYHRELDWIRKMPRARRTKAKARVDAFDDIKKKALQKKTNDKLEIAVKVSRLGGKILELIKISKSFGEKKILNSFSYTFKKNEKIGVVGKNGTGKSTFLNIILGLEKYDSGKIQTGETVVYGYYSQKGLEMSEDKRVVEVVKEIAEYIPLANGTKLSASQLLQRFLFTPEMQYTFVSKLSGGEKRRLYLCKVLMKNPNFLILDEPTNDLDIITLSTLEEFLADFQGCVLVVSHDRYFMDRLSDHLFVFEGDGVIKDFPGNYTEYRNWKDEQEIQQREKNNPAKTEKDEIEKHAGEIQPEGKPVKKKLSYHLQRELDQLNKEIEQLEQRKKELESEMASGTEEYEKIQELSMEYEKLLSTLDDKCFRWMELQEG